MTTHNNSTKPAKLTVAEVAEIAAAPHPAQTLDGAKRAAAVLQAPIDPDAEGTIVYLDTGADLVFSLNADSTFTMTGAKLGGRELVQLTAAETSALWRFWLPICAQAVMQRITEAIDERRAERERDEQGRARLETMLEERRQQRRYTRVADIAVAPNCEPDTLSHPPRIVTAPDGSQVLQLKGNDGWQDDGVVCEVARLDSQGVVLVGLGDRSIVMSAEDFDNSAE